MVFISFDSQNVNCDLGKKNETPFKIQQLNHFKPVKTLFRLPPVIYKGTFHSKFQRKLRWYIMGYGTIIIICYIIHYNHLFRLKMVTHFKYCTTLHVRTVVRISCLVSIGHNKWSFHPSFAYLKYVVLKPKKDNLASHFQRDV